MDTAPEELLNAIEAVLELGPGCDGVCPPDCRHEVAHRDLFAAAAKVFREGDADDRALEDAAMGPDPDAQRDAERDLRAAERHLDDLADQAAGEADPLDA